MARYSILVVEDEHTLRRLLEYRLSKQYHVRTAANGEEALERTAEEIPDLIISDIMMPKMDGFALQAELQKHKDTKAIPFIFLTAKADEQSRLKGMRTGVDDYITKPFDIEQLLSRIDRLLERTKIFQEQLDARIGQDFSRKLMPKTLPQVEGYRALFHNSPLEHGGGDLFDWTEPEPGVFFFTIGDVMGKGLQAKFLRLQLSGLCPHNAPCHASRLEVTRRTDAACQPGVDARRVYAGDVCLFADHTLGSRQPPDHLCQCGPLSSCVGLAGKHRGDSL